MKPFKYHLALISATLLISSLSVTALHLLTRDIIHRKNSFLRIFPPHALNNLRVFDIGYNSYYIAGLTDSTIFLANSKATNHMLIVKSDLSDSSHITLYKGDSARIAWKVVNVSVDSLNIYMMEGITPTVIQIKYPSLEHSKNTSIKDKFNFSVPISNGSIVVRMFDTIRRQYVLKKISTQEEKIYRLETQGDGTFSVDGMLSFDNNYITYLYYYRNEFLCLDTNLNLIGRGHTIDTNTLAKIRVDTILSENKVTLSAPPVLVNKKSCTSNKLLFVNSGLLAKNEDKDEFKLHSVIDVYSTPLQQYKYSFYLPSYKNKKIHDFKVHGDLVAALNGKYLILYNFNVNK